MRHYLARSDHLLAAINCCSGAAFCVFAKRWFVLRALLDYRRAAFDLKDVNLGHFRRKYPDLMAAVRLLLLLPFVLTALLPKGFMPDVRADGGFTVTLCTTEGLRTVTLDANGVEIPPASDQDSPDDKTSHHCVFASIGAFAVPGKVSFVFGQEEIARQPVSFSAHVWTASTSRGRNFARAPPLIV